MQHTLSVLHTLRSSEWTTAGRKRSASAASPATSQAPPVPCRLTGVPGLAGDGAELGDGGARAPGDGERQPAVVEQRPAGGAGRRPHERDRAGRQAGGGERRLERVR